MKLLVTGKGQPLADLVIGHLQGDQVVCLPEAEQAVDWCDVEAVGKLMEGVETVLHLAWYDAANDRDDEGQLLDVATRSTYVVLDAAVNAGVNRVIMVSNLALFQSYPDNYVIDESWQPQPCAEASSLAPYLVELCCREFARSSAMSITCLRFGDLDCPDGTSSVDALNALDHAMHQVLDPAGYRWQIFHVCSSSKFSTQSAKKAFNLERA